MRCSSIHFQCSSISSRVSASASTRRESSESGRWKVSSRVFTLVHFRIGPLMENSVAIGLRGKALDRAAQLGGWSYFAVEDGIDGCNEKTRETDMLFVVASSTLQCEVRIRSISGPGGNRERGTSFEETHQKPVTCDGRESKRDQGQIRSKGGKTPTRTSEGLTHIVVRNEGQDDRSIYRKTPRIHQPGQEQMISPRTNPFSRSSYSQNRKTSQSTRAVWQSTQTR